MLTQFIDSYMRYWEEMSLQQDQRFNCVPSIVNSSTYSLRRRLHHKGMQNYLRNENVSFTSEYASETNVNQLIGYK